MSIKAEFKNFMRLGNPFTQNIIGGWVLFCTVGIYLALTGLGAGGGKPTAQQVASTTNALLYALFTCTGFFGGTLLNTIGPKLTLALGAFGYPVYVSGLWYYDSTGNEWFPLLGGAILGISAGWLWTAVGFIQFAYGEEQDKGFYIATQLFMLACGSTVGALIAFGINADITTASGVPESVDIAFVVIQLCAVILALVAVIKPSQVVRRDGRHIAIFKAPSVKEEFMGCIRLLKDPKILMLLIPMFCTEITLSFVPTINAYAFNLRTRSLNNVLYNAIQIPTCFLYARVLDNTRFRRRIRGMIGLAISSTLIISGWIVTLIFLKRFNIDSSVPSPNYDWTDPEFAGLMIQYLIFGCLYALHHMLVQWVLSSWTNEPTQLARYAGLFKGILSAGLCVGFGLESAGVSYWNQAIIQMTLQFVSLPIILYLILTYTKDTNYFIEKDVIPPEHVESEMIAAGKVTPEEALEILKKEYGHEKPFVEVYNVPEDKAVPGLPYWAPHVVHRGIWLTPVDGRCIGVNFLPGKFVTEKKAAHELAKDIENMWSGNIFDYSLRRLLLLYYRSHFALNREMRYKDLIKLKAEEAKKRKNKKLKTRSQDLLTQYLRDSKPAPQNQDDDESHMPLSSYIKSGLAESVKLALDHEPSEEADTVKESSAAIIGQLVAVTKKQLYDATSVNELPSKLENV